jgi:hypothetical protein
MTSLTKRFVALAAEIVNIEPERRLPGNSNGRYGLQGAVRISGERSFQNEKQEPKLLSLFASFLEYQAAIFCFLRRATTPSKPRPASIMA